MRLGWRILAGIAVLLACVSCTELKRVPRPEVNAQQLVGHEIRVTTTDGRILEFRLLTVTDDALIGTVAEVSLDEIALVERHDVSLWKTACLVTGGLAAAYAIGILYFLLTFDQSTWP